MKTGGLSNTKGRQINAHNMSFMLLNSPCGGIRQLKHEILLSIKYRNIIYEL